MLDRFVVCTDAHLANRPPENRIDDYNESILKKLNWVTDFCAEEKIRNIIFAGDLCHTHRTNDELMFRFVELMSSTKIDFYYLLGNHDIQGGNSNFIQKTNMGLLSKYHWFHLLDQEKPYEFKNCYLTGINYSVEKEVCDTFMWWEGRRSGQQIKLDPKKKVILVTHAMITNEQMEIKGVPKSVCVNNVSTNADLLINGHYHIGHKGVVVGEELERKFKIINPGSIARMNIAEAQESHGPRIAVVTVDGETLGADGIKIRFVKVPCKAIEDVFDAKDIEEKKNTKKDKQYFIDSMRAIGDEKIMSGNFASSLEALLKNPPKKLAKKIKPRVRKLLLEKLSNHS